MTSDRNISLEKLASILDTARKTAAAYYELTGKPLGITGEVGEYEAARLLNLRLVDARTPGYDAIGLDGRLIQIKTRMHDPSEKITGKRMGGIKQDSEFHTVMLVMLDREYNPWIIWEAPREQILSALRKPGSRARNENGTLGISKFRSIATVAWKRS